jgi:hypothetical protein
MLLFPDPQPLVEQLGRDFFRTVPECPGVYLMRDAGDAVLYVGKAKNLRQRLGHYRVANPDRLPRRHLRLLRAVVRIELQELPDEPSALARESELLRTLKPKFNRAGTWPVSARFLIWQQIGEKLELAVTETPEPGWEAFGPLGSPASFLRNALIRLLWCAVHPKANVTEMPRGWMQSRFENFTGLHTGNLGEEIGASLRKLFSDQPDEFAEWLRAKVSGNWHPFNRTAIETDLEFLSRLFSIPVRDRYSGDGQRTVASEV